MCIIKSNNVERSKTMSEDKKVKKISKLNTVIGSNLKNYRKANKISGEQIAYILDMNYDTYRSWESGRTTPKLQAIIDLAKIYNISIQDLLVEHSQLKDKNTLIVATNSENGYNQDIYADEYLSKLSTFEKVLVMKVRLLDKEDKEALIKSLNEIMNSSHQAREASDEEC